MSFLENLIEIFEDNQVILTALGFGGAGAIIMWLKDIPKAIFNFLKREFTTELTITSHHRAFYDVMQFIESTYKHKNFRKFKVLNGRWGDDENAILGIGYGPHIIKYKQHLLFLTLSKESANQTNRDKDILFILKIGRKHDFFNQLIQDAQNMANQVDKNKIYKMESDWSYIKNQNKRSLDSIYLEENKRALLLSTIDQFIANESWYLDHGVPYQLGILLYGPPGTGKTSLIKAVASYLNYSIYYLPSSEIYKIERGISRLPNKSILVIEDIDTNSLTNARKNMLVNKNTNEDARTEACFDDKELFESFYKTGLSEILNSLDGIFSVHGRILMATTNHPESLDPALVRPGRIDLKIEIGYVNVELLEQFCNGFFPNNNIDFDSIHVCKPNIAIAFLQNMVLEGKSVDDIIKFMA